MPQTGSPDDNFLFAPGRPIFCLYMLLQTPQVGPPVAELPDMGREDLDNGNPDHGAVAQIEHENVDHQVQQWEPAYSMYNLMI